MKDVFILKRVKFFVLFLFVPFWVSAQTLTINGTIKDATGETLIGVSVVLKSATHPLGYFRTKVIEYNQKKFMFDSQFFGKFRKIFVRKIYYSGQNGQEDRKSTRLNSSH